MKVCRDVLSPLIRADGGELYVVSAAPASVHLHLGGTCGGCPGAAITRDSILDPAVRAVFPKATLRVTTGYLIPDGAQKM
jgi:Fe-S cluster biogenesis protein NfuA